MDSQDSHDKASLNDRLQVAAARHKGHKAPALSYAVATTSGVFAAGAVGMSDLSRRQAARVDDQYPWFSMTKIATATATVRLHARGDLDLDDPIGTYLRSYMPSRHGHPTVRQVLTHTAGLANPLPIRWVRPDGQPANQELLNALVSKHGRARRAPGGRAAYSNIGYLIAGKVIEAVTQVPVEEALNDLVLRPLSMDRTGFIADPRRPRATGYVKAPRLLEPAIKTLLPRGIAGPRVGGLLSLQPFLVEGAAYGGLVGPACDVVKLAVAHLPRPSDDTLTTGPLGDLREMHSIRCKGRPFDHGIGWFRKPMDAARSPAFVEHYGTGGGFWNAMRIYPAVGIAAVGMTNATSTWPFDDFFTAVVETLIGNPSDG